MKRSVVMLVLATTVTASPTCGTIALAASARDTAGMPQAIAQAQAFEGRIEYDAARTDVRDAAVVHGILEISGPHWQLKESGPGYSLEAGDGGSALRSGSTVAAFDDPIESDALANPWAIALGRLHAEGWSASPGSARRWTTTSGLSAYLDPTGEFVAGVDDQAAAHILSLTFSDWTTIDGLDLPRTIVRSRDGATIGSFEVVRYSVLRLASQPDDAASQPFGAGQHQAAAAAARGGGFANDARGSAGWVDFFKLCELLALAIAIVAWLRRDAFIATACRRLAQDPRAFTDQGVSVFVSPDGMLYFDGCEYRVGAHYYGRPAIVQTSPLFVRVTAKGVSRAAVLPRKLRPPHQAARRRNVAALVRGVSLIEVLVAMSMFALVVVAGVYPTLISITRANAFAQARSAGLRLAQNALTDEEAACAYGNSVFDGTTTAIENGMSVTVTVRASTTVGAHDIVVAVDSAEGAELARLATTVGPPVPAPSQPPGKPEGP